MEVLKKAPKRGDIIWLDFNPKLGREQKGHRPALVISHYKYNKNFQLALVVPISKQIKGYAVEVVLPAKNKVEGVILTNQVNSIDWKARQAAFAERVDNATFAAVLKRIHLLID